MKTISIRFCQQDLKKIERMSEKTGLSRSQLIRDGIQYHIHRFEESEEEYLDFLIREIDPENRWNGSESE